jgi:hypothetical protein
MEQHTFNELKNFNIQPTFSIFAGFFLLFMQLLANLGKKEKATKNPCLKNSHTPPPKKKERKKRISDHREPQSLADIVYY